MGIDTTQTPDGTWIATDTYGDERGLGWTREEAIDDLCRRASTAVFDPRERAEVVTFRGARR